MPEKKSETARIREDIWGRYSGAFEPYWQSQKLETEFLEGDRYEVDEGSHNRDRRLIQIRGQEISDTIRHVVAKLTDKPRSIEARPVDQIDDPDTAEVAVSLIERDLGDPFVGFNREFYMALTDACERRIGFVWMDWDPDCGPFGKRIFSRHAPDKIMWDPAWHPHHPKCPWMLRIKRIDVGVAQKVYKAPWLKSDRELDSNKGRGGSFTVTSVGHHLPRPPAVDDNKVTIWECWYKNDRTVKESPKEMGSIPLEKSERYLLCTDCGYRSDTQGQLGQELPEYFEPADEIENPGGGCPSCGGALERVDAKAVDAYEYAYTKGRRLVVMAPYATGGDDKPLYDKSWPVPAARSFPVLVITRYVKPGAPMGDSDVVRMWDAQVAADQLDTLAVQRIFERRNYWIMPKEGIYNWKGDRFGFRDDDYNVMYRDTSSSYPVNVERIEGTSLDPGWSIVRGRIDSVLTRYRPQLDIGPAEESTRDIAVGTIERITKEAEVSTADFARRINDELSMFYGVVWDYIRNTLTYDEAARLRIEGIDQVLNLMADSLPNYDFVVEESPEFSGLEEARAKAFPAMLQVMQQAQAMALDPLELMRIFAELNNLPKSVIRRFEKLVTEAQQKAEEAAAEGAATMAQQPGMEGGMTPEDMAAIEALSGGIGPPA